VAVRRLFRFKILVGLLLLLAVIYFLHPLWLSALGSALVFDEGPAKAETVVVLAGDYWGHRIEKAAELVRAGYAPSVLVSGPPGFYGVNESEAAVQFAVRQGYPAAWFIAVPHSATSTRDEAAVMLAELRRRNIHSFLLVTSNFHTARARRIYRATERAMGGGPSMRVVACPDQYYTADSWWRKREGWKTAYMEWTKTITGVFGI
jgi:uncharacterized SAM-binding protein YcdF (DUF218 family)